MKKPIPDQQQDFDLISRFYEFELTDQELHTFEDRLENDPVFQQRFRLYGEMEEHIDAEISTGSAPDFQKILKDASQKQEVRVRRLFSRQQLSIAATIALLLIAGFWWMLRPTVLDNPPALADFYWEATDKEHLFAGNQRGEDIRDPNESARTFFRSIRDYHAKGAYSTMIDQLEIYKVTTPAPIPFEDDADWLLAIAYVANDKLENAKFILEQIIAKYPAKREKAQQLLNDMEQMVAVGEVKK